MLFTVHGHAIANYLQNRGRGGGRASTARYGSGCGFQAHDITVTDIYSHEHSTEYHNYYFNAGAFRH